MNRDHLTEDFMWMEAVNLVFNMVVASPRMIDFDVGGRLDD